MKTSDTQKLIFLAFGSIFYFFFSVCCLAESQPKVSNLSHKNLFFVGRKEQLQMIHSFFKKEDRTILALTGGPGFGKTQIAKKYAQKFADNYELIWWFDAQQDIPSQFGKLATALNTLLSEKEQIFPSKMSKDVLVDTIKNVLRLKQIKYLLIFDNAEDYARIEKLIPYVHQPLGKHVILTSRIASIWPDKIEIGKFNREESLYLIKTVLSKTKKADMEKLAESLDDYPLELNVALAFIRSHPTVTINKYLEMHAQRTLKKRQGSSNTLLDQYPNNGLTALEISLKYIEEESKDSLNALFFMSLLNSKDIPETYIELWLKKAQSSLTSDEAIKHVYDQSLLGVSETTEFNANKKSKGQEDMYYLSIHDLIHQLINETLSIDEKKKFIEQAAEVLLEIFQGPAEVFTKVALEEPVHLLHAQKLCENAKAIGYVSPNLLKLKVCIFQCLVAPICNYEGAKIYLEEIEESIQSGIELEPYHRALLHINKGFFECIYNVNYEEAIRNMDEGLNLLTTFKQDDNDGKLRAIANLVQFYTLRGEMDIAESFIDKGKRLFDSVQSTAYKSFFIWAWALTLGDQGKFNEAISVLDTAKGLPNLFPAWKQGLMQQKVENLVKLGKIKESSSLLKEYEKEIKTFFKGKKHISFGNSLYFKSVLLIQRKENVLGALKHLTEALKIYEDFFRASKKHRIQARAHLAMGKAYKVKADFENAFKEYLLSEEIYDIVLKKKAIDDISDLYTELAILGIHLKDEGLTQKYLTAHIETFGLDHPRTEQILNVFDRVNLSVVD